MQDARTRQRLPTDSRRAYFIAVLCVVAGTCLHLALQPLVHDLRFLFFYPAVFFASWLGGLGPGLLATVLSALLVLGIANMLPHELFGSTLAATIQIAVFSGMGVLFSLFNARLREGNLRLQHEMAERQRIETELKHQTALLKTITDNAASALLMLDERGHPTFLNPAGERIMGYTLEQLQAQSTHRRRPEARPYPMSDGSSGGRRADPGTARGQSEQEDRFVRRDGRIYPARYSVAPLERDGRPAGSVIEFRDITAEQVLTDRLEFERRRFETAMSQIPAAVIIGEAPSGRLIFSNDRVPDVWGHPTIPAETIAEYARWTGFHSDGRPYTPEEWPLARAITHGETIENEEVLVPRSDGSRGVLRLSAAPVRDREGRIIAGVVMCQDVTQLVEAVRARDEFLTIASHEFKTPITSLKLALQTAQRSLAAGQRHVPLDPTLLDRLLDTSVRQTDRLARLVEDLLDVSRISVRGMPMEREPTDLAELTRTVLEQQRESLNRDGASITLTAATPVRAAVHRARFEQVLTNLLSNAVKYGAGRPVTVSVGTTDEHAEVRVTDRGMGIAPEHQARIFERFERAVSSQNISGLGVGLYIAREIVLAHGGEIRVESELGRGSTFIVRVPRLPEAAADGPFGARSRPSRETPCGSG